MIPFSTFLFVALATLALFLFIDERLILRRQRQIFHRALLRLLTEGGNDSVA